MASGLVRRANRPNTWLHRPACKREENPCQLGAAHTWHLAPFEESGDGCLRTPRILFFYGGTGHQAFSRISTALVASSGESTAT